MDGRARDQVSPDGRRPLPRAEESRIQRRKRPRIASGEKPLRERGNVPAPDADPALPFHGGPQMTPEEILGSSFEPVPDLVRRHARERPAHPALIQHETEGIVRLDYAGLDS